MNDVITNAPRATNKQKSIIILLFISKKSRRTYTDHKNKTIVML